MFIIIGIVLLIVVGLYIFMTRDVVSSTLNREVQNDIQTMNQIRDIEQAVEYCVNVPKPEYSVFNPILGPNQIYESIIRKNMREDILMCIDSLKQRYKDSLIINGEFKSTILKKNPYIVKYTIPIIITVNNVKKELSEFVVQYKINVGEVADATYLISEYVNMFPKEVPLYKNFSRPLYEEENNRFLDFLKSDEIKGMELIKVQIHTVYSGRGAEHIGIYFLNDTINGKIIEIPILHGITSIVDVRKKLLQELKNV